jgi:peptidylprolyl isomerase
VAKEGDTVLTHYRGWLADGTPFDNSYDRGKPFPVRNVGRAGVIKGWNEGLLGMKKGGKRRLVIPPELAYGPSGRPPVIPPAATLVFDVEVVDITTPPPPPPPDVFPDLATLKLVTSESGLRWADLAAGGGPEIQAGSDTLMHYTGWLEDGTKFDSSKDRGDTFPVRGVGRASVIKGWNEGLIGMKEGGKRVLVIPPDLGYGAAGAGGAIPPNATLVFAVEAVKVMPPAAAPVRAP